jgi:hypothetical protein
LTLAFGGTFQNLAHGQNGFLSAVLLGAGLLLVDSSPVAGGLVLGLLTYKPHLAVLIFVALMAGRRWRAWLAAVAAALSLALASALVLGLEVWPAFIKSIPLTMKQLASGILPLENLVTAAGAVLLLGGSLSLALALQGVVMLGAAWAVVRVWSRGASLMEIYVNASNRRTGRWSGCGLGGPPWPCGAQSWGWAPCFFPPTFSFTT